MLLPTPTEINHKKLIKTKLRVYVASHEKRKEKKRKRNNIKEKRSVKNNEKRKKQSKQK